MQIRRARRPLIPQRKTISQSRGGLVLWAGARRQVKDLPCVKGPWPAYPGGHRQPHGSTNLTSAECARQRADDRLGRQVAAT